jgi:hypothetical protein
LDRDRWNTNCIRKNTLVLPTLQVRAIEEHSKKYLKKIALADESDYMRCEDS